MRVGLELIRILLIFALLGGLGWMIIDNLYTANTEKYQWLGAIAIVLLLFVLYRNKLQFSGWYKGKGRTKLPRVISRTLIYGSILLIVLPFLLAKIV